MDAVPVRTHDCLQLLVFLGLLIGLTPLLGRFMQRVFSGGTVPALGFLRPIEKLVYRSAGIAPEREMSWQTYAVALLVFNAFGIVALLALQMSQQWLPLNPQALPNVPFPLALNTAVSF